MTDPGQLLADPQALRTADRAALLPAAATAGAQVRATVAGLTDALAALDGFRPRSLLIIADGRAALDAALVIALLGPRCPVPVLVHTDLPPWVGALDVVAMLESGTATEASAAAVARRRGAIVLVRGAVTGDLAEAVGGAVCPPPIGVPEALAGPGRLAFLLSVASACQLLHPALSDSIAETVAELLDAEALACSPQTDTFVNPAATLADQLTDSTAVIAGLDPAGHGLAGHAAAVLGELGGVPAAGMGAIQLSRSAALMRVLGTGRDVFADPFADPAGDPPTVLAILLRVDVPSDERFARVSEAWFRGLTTALPGAVVIDGHEMTLTSGDAAALGVRDGVGQVDELSGWSRQWAAAALIMLRIDFAAIYCGLLAGQVPPIDGPAGLGAHASSRHLLEPDTVVASHHDEEDFDQWN